MPTERFADRIVRHLARQGYEPQKIRRLALAMGIADDEYGDFHGAVKALMKTGRIVMGSASALTLPDPARRVVGRFRSNPRGFGFVIPDTPNSHGDLFVPPGHSGDAITGDTVSAEVLKRGKRDGRLMYEGRIVEIIERGQSRFVGELCRELKRWFVRPDGNILHVPIFVGDPGAKRARSGDQVVVEIVEYPSRGRDARGVITKVLGKRGDPGVDTQSIIHHYQLPDEFPAAVTEAAGRAVASYDPKAAARDREDLSTLTAITIDPDDARDFDDAISITELDDGRLELGVHIADVSHFVPPGGALDVEARERANSVYFPRLVIPMLPEVLSNGCLQPAGEATPADQERVHHLQRLRAACRDARREHRDSIGQATDLRTGDANSRGQSGAACEEGDRPGAADGVVGQDDPAAPLDRRHARARPAGSERRVRRGRARRGRRAGGYQLFAHHH